tara:strand:- start:160 stop:471 length:312 start_codon:yes stop_codon:yes gene_type:complete
MMMINLKQKWWNWHKENPEFYSMFEDFTFQAINRGHKRLSAWLIVNRIRWETMIVTTGDDYKISNDYIAFYSRLFMHDHPEYKGFFKTKTMKRGNIKEEILRD